MTESLSEDISHLPQVIYKEKTDQCHAKYDFPQDWHITRIENQMYFYISVSFNVESELRNYMQLRLYPILSFRLSLLYRDLWSTTEIGLFSLNEMKT